MPEALLTEEEKHRLLAVLQELDPAAPPEQRTGGRHKVMAQLWIRPLVKGGSRTRQRVMVVNVSRQGLAAMLPKEMAKGDKFCARLEFDEGGGRLMLCEVRNCRRLPGGHFKVGAQFLESIEDEKGDAKIPWDWLAYAR